MDLSNNIVRRRFGAQLWLPGILDFTPSSQLMLLLALN